MQKFAHHPGSKPVQRIELRPNRAALRLPVADRRRSALGGAEECLLPPREQDIAQRRRRLRRRAARRVAAEPHRCEFATEALKACAIGRGVAQPSVRVFDGNDNDQRAGLGASRRQPADGALWRDRRQRGFRPRAGDVPRFRRRHAHHSDRDRRPDPVGGRRPGRHHPHHPHFDGIGAPEGGAPGGAGRRPAAQPVRRPVFAGRRHPGHRHRDRGYGFRRVGDQPALHERRRRLYHRVQSGDPALPRVLSAGRFCATWS